MKKNLLLATSAIVASGFFATQAAAQVVVTIGGQMEFQAGYAFSEGTSATGAVGMGGAQALGGLTAAESTAINSGAQNPIAETRPGFPTVGTPADRAGDFTTNTDNITLRISNTADNGLSYGGEYRINNERVRIYLGGAFGRVNLGDWDTAAQALRVRVPFAGTDRFGGDAAGYIFNANLPSDGTAANGGAKITYLTTGTALDDTGLTLGLSYTPSTSDPFGINRRNTTYNDVGTVAFRYASEFSGVGVRLGAGYEFGSAANTFTVGDGAGVDYFVDNGGAGNMRRSGRSLSGWNAGAGVSVAGFDVGAQYIDRGASGQVSGFEDRTWAVGSSYTVGPWVFGVSYADMRQELGVSGTNAAGAATSANYTVEESRLGFGTTYTVAPGLRLQGDLAYIDSKWSSSGNNAGNQAVSISNDAWVGVVTTVLSF